VYGCCANHLYPLGRIGPDRLADLWAGPRSQVLRDALERWDLTVGCSSCSWHLAHGRMDPDAAVYDQYPTERTDPPGPVAMTFALSNRCNLGCTMCTPELSSTLRREAGLAPLASPYDDQFFEDLTPFLAGLRYAKFLGGEPFLIPEHHRVWDLMAQLDAPPRLQVTTNGTIWTNRVEWLLDRFSVDVTVSVDGTTPATYEAIRRGASFEEVRGNVERFAARCRAAGTELRLCFCLMAENAHELAPMLQWADRLGAPVSVNVVSDLGHALHDEPVDRLHEVLALGELQERSTPIEGNAEVWRTQLRQLRAVIAERGQAVTPLPRHRLGTPRDWLQPPQPSVVVAGWSIEDRDPPVVAVQRERLARWAAAGAVADLRATPDGQVTGVVSAHPRLGIDARLVGGRLDRLVEHLEQADGRPAWSMGLEPSDPEDPIEIRTMVLSEEHPVRGLPGSVVRVVMLPAADGWAVLVAEDRIYDTERSVPVAAPVLRAGGAPSGTPGPR
jgi:molybdenum cofactor biosynthesis enzyme MoaA